MRRLAVLCLAVLGSLAVCAKPQAPPPSAPAVVGVDEMARLDLLPRLKRSVKVGLVSSYDRSGGNDDGFSGKYSFIRKEPAIQGTGSEDSFNGGWYDVPGRWEMRTSLPLSGALPLGTFEMKKGENIVYLHLVGSDPLAKGMGMELAEIVFEKAK